MTDEAEQAIGPDTDAPATDQAEAPAAEQAQVDAAPPKPNRFQRRLQRARSAAQQERERADKAERELAKLRQQDKSAGGPQMGSFETFDEYEAAKKEWESRPVSERTQSSNKGIEQAAAEFRAQLDEWDDAPAGAIDAITANTWQPTEAMITTMIDLDNGPETALWLAEHPKTVKRLSGMDDRRQSMELVKIATRIEDNGKLAPAPPAAKHVSGNALNDPPKGPSDGAPKDWGKASFAEYEESRRQTDGSNMRGNW